MLWRRYNKKKKAPGEAEEREEENASDREC
jgi:hypothetical protein